MEIPRKINIYLTIKVTSTILSSTNTFRALIRISAFILTVNLLYTIELILIDEKTIISMKYYSKMSKIIINLVFSWIALTEYKQS